MAVGLVAAGAGAGLGRDGRQVVGPDAGEARPYASPAAAEAALQRFVRGVRDRDERALSALAPSGDGNAAAHLAGIARNAAVLDLVGVDARYVDQVGPVAADGSWTGAAEVSWRIHGFDPGPSRADVVVSFQPDGDRLAVVGFGGASRAGSRTPLWLQGELSVVRTPDTLVMADRSVGGARAVLTQVERGVDVVRRVLPDWDGRAVVEVPASAAGLDRALGVQPGTYAGIAAVTAPVDGSTAPDASAHVFVNPDVTDRLRQAGAQAVMSHELVHLATDAVGRPVEPWLLEGFADYVALRDVALPDRVILERAVRNVRRNGVPRALPDAADFGTRADDLQASYEQASLAVRIMAERLGEERLVAVYVRARRGEELADLLRSSGWSIGSLTRLWRTELSALARGSA